MSAPTGALAVLGRRRGRVIDGGPTPPRTEHAPWISGVLASAQACVLTVLLVALPALVVFVLSSGDPTNADVEWFASVRVGLALWLLGHGVPVVAGGTTISMVPLGLSLLCGFVLYASARRTQRPVASAYAAGVAAYAVLAMLVVLVAGLAGGPQLVMAAVGGVVVAGLGLGAGYVTHPDGPRLAGALEPLTSRQPAWMRLGIRAGLVAAGLAVAVASVLLVVWIFSGRGPMLDIARSLEVSGFDAVVLAAGQSFFAADLVVWALAWISGVGFSFGTGTIFSPTSAVVGPMPVVPLVGVVPTGQPAAGWIVVPAVLVLVGVAVGIFVHRRLPDARWRTLLGALGAVAVTTGVVVGVLVSLASGGVGPGRMQHVGADAFVVGLVVAGEVLLGAAFTTVLLNPATLAWFRSLVRGAREMLRRDGAGASPAASASASTGAATPASGSARTSASTTSSGTGTSSGTAMTSGTATSSRTATSSGTAVSSSTATSSASASSSSSASSARTTGTAPSARTGASARSARTVATGPSARTARTTLTTPTTRTVISGGTTASATSGRTSASAPSAD